MADKLITIATYSTISDAYIYKNLLDMEGIESYVVDSNASFTPPVPYIHDGGVKLSVKEVDAAKALSIINRDNSYTITEQDYSPTDTEPDKV